MSEPFLPDWAVEVDDADSTDTTAVLDFVGPTMNPVPSLGLMLTQRCSTRAGIIMYEPIRIALVPDQPILLLDTTDARAVRAALDALITRADETPYAPT